MFNIFKHFIRLWKRQKRFFIVNILGLSIGLAVSMLLILYVFNELSYDQYFSQKDRIVRLNSIWIENGNREFMPICTRKAFTELPSQIPQIRKALQLYRGGKKDITVGENHFADREILYADTTFFSLFDLKPVYGNPAESLRTPNTAVLTRKAALSVFGDINPVGKTFMVDTTLYTLGAVIQDIPLNTHFRFDILFPMESVSNLQNMGGLEFFTYFLLEPQAIQIQTNKRIESVYKQMLKKGFSDFSSDFDARLEPLTELHLHSRSSFDLSEPGNYKLLWILIGLAGLILVLAVTNFINLYLVQGENRSTEIGVRKVNGAGDRTMILQFFGEAGGMVMLSFLLGIMLMFLLIPGFSQLIGKPLEVSMMYTPSFLLSLITLMLLVILCSGTYPAFYLNRLNPVLVLRNKASKGGRKQRIVSAVVIFQSAITIFLITILFVVNQQIHLLKSIPLHYHPEHILVVQNPGVSLKEHLKAIKDRFAELPEVVAMSGGHHIPGLGYSGQGLYKQGESHEKFIPINEYRLLPGACELFKFELLEGRLFTEQENDKQAIILNETAVKRLGFKNPIGEKVIMFDDPLEIIGVVKDFYYESTAQAIQPLAITNYITNPYVFYIRFKAGTDPNQARALTEKTLKEFDRDYVLNANWCDDLNKSKYYREESLSTILKFGTLLSLFIALLGLYAIHSYQMLQRTKEIGLRRILGSKTGEIIQLTSRSTFRWLAYSTLLALPSAYLVSQNWLQNFSNRISLSPWLFLTPILIQLLFAFLITAVESLRTVRINPVESLRYE